MTLRRSPDRAGRPVRVLYTWTGSDRDANGFDAVEQARQVASRLNPELFEPTISGDGEPALNAGSRRGQFDIWHSLDTTSASSEALRARKVGVRFVYTKSTPAWDRKWWLKSAVAAGVAVPSHQMIERYFGDRWLKRLATYVPPGVDAGEVAPRERGQELRARLGIHPTAPVVSCLGDIEPLKGQRDLTEAVTRIEGLHLVLVGAEPHALYAEAVRYLMERTGAAERLHMLGPDEDTAAALGASDLYCQPSLVEVFPLALLRAMAAGVPSIATGIGGNHDVIRDEQDGLLVKVQSWNGFENALRRLIAEPDLRRRLAAAGRQRVTDAFNVALAARRHEQLYLRVLGSRRS